MFTFAFVEFPWVFFDMRVVEEIFIFKSMVNFFYILAMNSLINADCININIVPF